MCGPVQVNLSGGRVSAAGEFEIARQVQRALADLAGDDAGGRRPVSQPLRPPRNLAMSVIGESRADAVHAADEVVDHAVGLGMAWIEAVQFAVGDHVDAGQFLRLQDHQDGVAQRAASKCRLRASAVRGSCRPPSSGPASCAPGCS